MSEEAIKARRDCILQKYVKKEKISEADWKWMDEIDWHPVDEMQYKKSFIEKSLKAKKEKAIKAKSISDLFR